MDRTLRGAQAYIRRTAGVHQSHSKSVLLSAFKTLYLSFSGENGVAMTKPISASFSGAIGVIETCGRRIGSEPRKRVVRKGTSRFQFVPVCGKREQTGTLMGAGPGALPSAFICAICGSFPAGRPGGGPGAFKVQRFKVQRFNGPLSCRLPFRVGWVLGWAGEPLHPTALKSTRTRAAPLKLGGPSGICDFSVPSVSSC